MTPVPRSRNRPVRRRLSTWERGSGPRPFVTRARLRRTDGTTFLWDSRTARKTGDADPGSTWWAPRARGWWIGVLFAVGSTCFALGALPAYANLVGTDTANVTFFVGSLFFTAAASMQHKEAADAAARLHHAVTGERPSRWRVLAWSPQRIDWWATTIQFAGTLLFNLSTFAALRAGLDVQQQERQIWAPDLYGSIAFLIASAFAWGEAGHAWLSWRPRSRGWRIAALNLLGSVAFGISALGAYILPTTGALANARAAQVGTFVGAICFLAGGVLLLPERTATDEPDQPDTTPIRGG